MVSKERAALYVGVSKYPNAQDGLGDLPGNAVAAHRMCEAFAGNAISWPGGDDAVVAGCVGDQQLRDSVKRLLQNAGGRNRIPALLYIAAHGVCLAKEDGSLMESDEDYLDKKPGDLLLLSSSYNSDPTAAKDEGRNLRFSQIIRWIQLYKPGSVTIILDCCHAGAASAVPLPPDVNVIVMGACDYMYQAIGTTEIPDFTDTILGSLDSSSADIDGNVTAMSLFANAYDLMDSDQKPVLITNACANPSLYRLGKVELPENDVRNMVCAWHPYREVAEPDCSYGTLAIRKADGSEGRIKVGDCISALFPTANAYCDVFPWMETERFWLGPRAGNDERTAPTDAMLQMDCMKELRKNGLLKAYIRNNYREKPDPDGADGKDLDLYWAVIDRCKWFFEKDETKRGWLGKHGVDDPAELQQLGKREIADLITQADTGRQGYVCLTPRGRLVWRLKHRQFSDID